MQFVLIPAGTFQMGSPESEPGRSENEKQHQVTINQPFYLQTTPVTQGQWQKVIHNNPSYFKECGEDCPVEMVSWEDAQGFIENPNQMEKTDSYRMPTEAEWEYACRAKSTRKWGFIDNEAKLEEHAWYIKNSGDKTQPVGKKKPNAWGLYDMHGNVCEWCQDWHGDYPPGPVTDPKGPPSGEYRAFRGGSWGGIAGFTRSANRNRRNSYSRHSGIGFRVARAL
jgi:formylglycine-generating enzyme required for sulfatase activity